MKEEIEMLRTACISFNQSASKLAEKHAAVEKKVGDLYHRLELHSLNAVQMVKLAKELRQTLQERRRVKDYMRYQQAFMGHTKALLDSASKIDNTIVVSRRRWKEMSDERAD